MHETVVADINSDMGDEDAPSPEEYQVTRLQAVDINRRAGSILLVTAAGNMQPQLLEAVLDESTAIKPCLGFGTAEYVGYAALAHGNVYQACS